jgi:hypothetical protein
MGVQFRYVFGKRCRVAFQHEQIYVIEGLLDPIRIERLTLGQMDLLGGRRLLALVRVEEDLMEFLAGTGSGDLDDDVASGLKSRESDHRLREIDDPDRLTHIEHEHLTAALGQGA